jgi:RNA polymerase sigma factor (sigma-70 family)
MTKQRNALLGDSNFDAFKTQYDAILENPSHPIWLFIYRNLKLLQLRGVEPSEVLHEVWLCGIQAIEAGRPINNPKAWIRTVAYRILIKEVRRLKPEKIASVSFDTIEPYALVGLNTLNNNDESENCYQVLWQSICKLNQEDKMLIILRFFRKLSWEEIREVLISDGIEVTNVAVLRKRGQRALERLRNKYHQQD